MLLSGGTIFLAKHFMPYKIYLFWLIVGGPTVVSGAVFAARQRIRNLDPEWGYPLARVFTVTLFIYSVVAVAFPFVEAQLPDTVSALFRREQQTDLDLGSDIDPPMLEAQRALLIYGNEIKNSEAEQLGAGFKKLAKKRKDGTFGPEDEAQEQELLERYVALSKKLSKLQAIAKGQAQLDNLPSSQQPNPAGPMPSVTPGVARSNLNSGPTNRSITTLDANPYANLVHFASSSGHQIALAISTDGSNGGWVDTLKAQLREADARVQPDVFDMSKMNEGGIFNQIYDGQIEPLDRSGALSHFHYIALMRVQKRCAPSTVSGTQLISCSLAMQAKAYDSSGQTLINTSAQAAGAGFSEDEALDNAAKRLADEAKVSVLVPLPK